MKQFFLAALLLVGLSATLSAQTTLNKAFDAATLSVDTLTNADTINFSASRYVVDNYDLNWQVVLTSLSGTVAATAYLEASLCASCSDWTVLDTVALDANTLSHIFTQSFFPGYRARVRVVSSGTQSSEVDNHIIWRRREDAGR